MTTNAEETMVFQTSLPYTCWSDFSLISDEKCLEALYFYPVRNYGERPYDAIVIDDDHAAMWNVDSRFLVGLKNGLNASSSGGQLLQERQPFWVDSYGNAHLLADDLVSEKQPSEECIPGDLTCQVERAERGPLDNTELLLENRYEDELRKRFNDSTTIHVLLARNLNETLRRRPNARLLLVDQYDRFLSGATVSPTASSADNRNDSGRTVGRVAEGNLDYVFTSAPQARTMTSAKEELFYELCRRQQARYINRRINVQSADRRFSSVATRDISRHAHLAWSTFVPENDCLPERYTDIRLTNYYVFEDSTSVVFWRNLVAQMLLLHANRPSKTDVATNGIASTTNTAIVIRLSFSVGNENEARDGTNGDRFDYPLACLRRLKRFMSFICKLYAIVSDMNLLNVPDFYWSVCGDQIDILHELHNMLTREYVIGVRERLVAYDRFLHLDLAASVLGTYNLVRSHCALRNFANETNPDATIVRGTVDCSRNVSNKIARQLIEQERTDSAVSGIFYSTLVGPNLLTSPVCRLGVGVSFLVQSRDNAFIYKLREFEY